MNAAISPRVTRVGCYEQLGDLLSNSIYLGEIVNMPNVRLSPQQIVNSADSRVKGPPRRT